MCVHKLFWSHLQTLAPKVVFLTGTLGEVEDLQAQQPLCMASFQLQVQLPSFFWGVESVERTEKAQVGSEKFRLVKVDEIYHQRDGF